MDLAHGMQLAPAGSHTSSLQELLSKELAAGLVEWQTQVGLHRNLRLVYCTASRRQKTALLFTQWRLLVTTLHKRRLWYRNLIQRRLRKVTRISPTFLGDMNSSMLMVYVR